MKSSFYVLAGLMLACAALAAPAPDPFVKVWGHPIDPDRDCKIRREGASLSIEMPGTGHDYDPVRKQFNAPRIVREVDGDFDLQARIRIDCNSSVQSTVKGQPPYVSAGFLILFPEVRNYNRVCMRFDYCMLQRKSRIDYAGKSHLPDPRVEKRLRELGIARSEWIREVEKGPFVLFRDWGFFVERSEQIRDVTIDRDKVDESSPIVYDPERQNWPMAKNANTAYVRVEQRGAIIHFFLSPDGKKWTGVLSTGPSLLAKGKVGLAAYSTSSEPSKVCFDQIKFSNVKKKER
jgi:hypothetical protein